MSTIDDWVSRLLSGDTFVFLLAAYLGMIALERLVAFVVGDRRRGMSDLSNLVTSAIPSLVSMIGLGAVFVLLYQSVYQLRLFDMPTTAVWGWVAVFVIHEFCYYLDHRLAHRIGFFWAFHQVHHASNEMDLTVASRGSVFDVVIQWTYWTIPPLLGVSLPHLLAAKFFVSLWGIFNHTRLVHRMGWLEQVMATPANHRVHHGRQPKYLDRNYSQFTVLFDRLFGTFQPEEEEPDYGLVTRLETLNPIDHHLVGFRWLWQQLRAAPNWRARLNYLIKPPGWSHDGRHTTTAVLVAQAEAARQSDETAAG